MHLTSTQKAYTIYILKKYVISSLKGQSPTRALHSMVDRGILNVVFPLLGDLIGHTGGIYHSDTVWEHTLLCVSNIKKSNRLLRLAALFHDVGKPMAYISNNKASFVCHQDISAALAAESLSNVLSADDMLYVEGLISYHMLKLPSASTSKKSMRKLLRKLYKHNIPYNDFIRLKIADRKSNLNNTPYPIWRIKQAIKLAHDVNTAPNKVGVASLAINGRDVMHILNLPSGRCIGDILRRTLYYVREHPQCNNKDDLYRYICALDRANIGGIMLWAR